MHTTGIVRRIDELGRVVIPKEIRRTMRIREGEELEIYTDDNQGLVLRKYSAIKSVIKFAEEYAGAINYTTGHTVLVCDKDTFVSASGSLAKDYQHKQISHGVENIIMGRKRAINSNTDACRLTFDDDTSKYKGQIIEPILVRGDVFGAIIMLSVKNKMTEVDIKLMDTAKAFLERQI